MPPEHFLRLAIAKAREGIEAGQSPFGSVIVKDGQVISLAHNTVWRDSDPTAHAEVNAIRQAAKALKSINLAGSTLYSTCEPCPMCLSAIHWAKIDEVHFGARIADAAAAGFSELSIEAEVMVQTGKSHLRVQAGLLVDECRELFALFRAKGLAQTY